MIRGVLRLLLLEWTGELAPVYHLLKLFIDDLLCTLDTRRALLCHYRSLALNGCYTALLIAGLDLVRGVLDHDDMLALSMATQTWIVALAHELFVKIEA